VFIETKLTRLKVLIYIINLLYEKKIYDSNIFTNIYNDLVKYKSDKLQDYKSF
jgi:hypothetical protein